MNDVAYLRQVILKNYSGNSNEIIALGSYYIAILTSRYISYRNYMFTG